MFAQTPHASKHCSNHLTIVTSASQAGLITWLCANAVADLVEQAAHLDEPAVPVGEVARHGRLHEEGVLAADDARNAGLRRVDEH